MRDRICCCGRDDCPSNGGRGRKAVIRPKRRDNWQVVPNLWGAIFARPTTLNTPALSQVLQPLRALEAKAQADYDINVTRYVNAKRLSDLKRSAVEAQLKDAFKKGKDTTALAARLAEEEPPEPTLRRYITHDSTVEKQRIAPR